MNEMRWVLLAEDDDDIRSMIRHSLEEEAAGLNLQVVEARDGAEALQRAGAREFHCVVTDLRMPRSTGEDLLRALQSQPLNANTPTLVVSGHADDRDFAERFSHVRVIPKPFLPQDVARAVVREIKLGRMDDRVAAHLMNPFLDALRHYLSDVLKLELDQVAPAVKKPGDVLQGDLHCTMTMTNGLSKARFTLSFDRVLLDHLKAKYFSTRVANWASFTSDVTARHFCQVVFERLSPTMQKIMGGQVRLVGTSVVLARSEEPSNEVELSDLVKGSGILVSLVTPFGRVLAGAYAKPKAKRL